MSARRCVVRDGRFVEPCNRLKEVTECGPVARVSKGVVAWELHNLAARPVEPSRTFYGVRSGTHTKRGLIFNFCPFCGERIDGPVQAPHEQDGAGEREKKS